MLKESRCGLCWLLFSAEAGSEPRLPGRGACNSDLGRKVLISDTNSRIECTLTKLADDTKLGGVVSTPEGWNAIQRDLDKLKTWVHVNLVRFTKAKCRVLQLGWGKLWYQYWLVDEGVESSPAKKDLGLLVDKKPGNVCWQPRRPTIPWAAPPAAWAQGEGGDSAPLPCSAETPWESCVQLWSPQHRTELELWERGQRRMTKVI